ncbi:hypothetical protein ACFL30_02265 [Candidatus Latescibacterota bacterium]
MFKKLKTITLCNILIFFIITAIIGCSKNSSPIHPDIHNKNYETPVFSVEVLKWFEGHQAAVSITYDALWGQWKAQEKLEFVVDETLRRGLRIDYEFVTAKYDYPEYEFIIDDIRERVIPSGIHFFGHGHEHINHDSLTYDAAYTSFKRCYDLMKEWNIEPRAYAYPFGAGRKPEIQCANEDAGFICARGVSTDPSLYYICPGEKTEPDNWQYLPVIPVGQDEPGYIGSHSDMEPLVQAALEKNAWIIIMYHSIGFTEGWGYYPMDEFLKDIDFIEAHDVWGGNMDAVACYIRENNNFQETVTFLAASDDSIEYEILFHDGLDNAVYNQPLTIEFTFDPEVTINNILVSPTINGQTRYPVKSGKVQLNVVPDEQKYRMKLMLE